MLPPELLPKLFSPSRHYVDLATVQRTIEAEALTYEHSTLKRYLSEWQKEGKLQDAGRGWYSDLLHPLPLNERVPILTSLRTLMASDFTLLAYSLWSTRQLAHFFHHLPTHHATFLMVEREAFETVAEALEEEGYRVVIHPLGKEAQKFALKAEDTIILRPLLASDEPAPQSPPEQILVDLYHETHKLGLLELAEYERLAHDLMTSHRINIAALSRYAARRKIDPQEILHLAHISPSS